MLDKAVGEVCPEAAVTSSGNTSRILGMNAYGRSSYSKSNTTGSNNRTTSTSASTAPGGAASGESLQISDLHEHTKRVLGHYYMELHGLGDQRGFNVHIEDARMILRAYWYMSESRLVGDVQTLVEQLILQQLPEYIDKELLGHYQGWCTADSISVLLCENERVMTARKSLLSMRVQYREALKKIHEIAPDTGTSNTLIR